MQQPTKKVNPSIKLKGFADRKDIQIHLGPLETNKEGYKYKRVYWIDADGEKRPVNFLLEDLKVQFGFSKDPRSENRVKMNMGVLLDEKQEQAIKPGLDRLNDELVKNIFEQKEEIFEDHENIICERDVRNLYWHLGSFKKRKGKGQNAGKLYEPTLTLHAIMTTDKETGETTPRMTVVDTNRQKHDPTELTSGSIIDAVARVSHLWIGAKVNCNLQILRVGCKQFGRVEEEEELFPWENESTEQSNPFDPFGFDDTEGNNAMVPDFMAASVESKQVESKQSESIEEQPMDQTSSSPGKSPKRKLQNDQPRSRKRARHS